jgi:type I restriction enzyme S subunit
VETERKEMTRWPIKPLGELLKVQNGFAFKSELFNEDGKGLPIIRIRDLARGFSETFFDGEHDPAFEVENGDFLIGMDGEFHCYRWQGGKALLNQRVCRLQNFSRDLNPSYVFYGINDHLREIEDNTAFVTVKHLSSKQIASIEMTLPPLPEQERLVKLLDEADELRKLRAQANRRTDDLIPALFNEMFGDPDESAKGLPVLPFGELLAEPLRNGLSPAKDGSYPAKVFTLSAITGEEFDGTALKEASFARLPDRTCQTTEHLFLICRGNGNRELVGCGKFPLHLTMNTVFPDTMIAAVPNLDRLLPAFLEAAWKQPATRSQIRSSARTTNGTFKINQTAIEQIRLPVPPLPLQEEFAARVSDIRAMQAEQAVSRRRLDDLFHSMLYRAFQGES